MQKYCSIHKPGSKSHKWVCVMENDFKYPAMPSCKAANNGRESHKSLIFVPQKLCEQRCGEARRPICFSKLQQFSHKEWARIPANNGQKLVKRTKMLDPSHTAQRQCHQILRKYTLCKPLTEERYKKIQHKNPGDIISVILTEHKSKNFIIS